MPWIWGRGFSSFQGIFYSKNALLERCAGFGEGLPVGTEPWGGDRAALTMISQGPHLGPYVL